ncbi:hypothetical protein [Salinicola halophilus]|uniref:hypothetical protein n=1 Tax=Salinicola halophilus TaxID=184065 RepID=UPI000DA1D8F4|nr:hypothetical protein [Salinicola halophilus]
MADSDATLALQERVDELLTEVLMLRDASLAFTNIHPNTSEGLSNTADGKYFTVPGSDDAFLRLYRREGGKATHLADYPTSAALRAVVDGLGTAASRNVGTSEGELLERGAFGVGANRGLFVNSLADIDGSGIYALSGQLSDATVPYAGRYSSMLTGKRYGSKNSITFGSGIMLLLCDGYPAREVLTGANIVGSIGEGSAAVIERGRNSNGNYTKFSDGTMHCWTTDHVLARQNFVRYGADWTFPAAFSEAPATRMSLTMIGAAFDDAATRENISTTATSLTSNNKTYCELYTLKDYRIPEGSSIRQVIAQATGYWK